MEKVTKLSHYYNRNKIFFKRSVLNENRSLFWGLGGG
jgi:hypothetical protein